MSELFVNESNNKHLSLPAVGSAVLPSSASPWQDCGAEGFWIKPLLEDKESGLRTWLMKVDAGAFSAMHAHDEIEQIYVIEGSFCDQDHRYAAGDYIVRAAGAMHTAGSDEGALVMLVYTP
jgi:anti-sigma factor ChrR (cupin superfamily)